MTRLWSTARAIFGDKLGVAFIELAIITGLIGLLAAIAPSTTQAGTLTDDINGERLTVLKVDAAAGSVQCVEDRRWKAVEKADLVGVGVGDIVRVEQQRLILLRTAAEEIAGIER